MQFEVETPGRTYFLARQAFPQFRTRITTCHTNRVDADPFFVPGLPHVTLIESRRALLLRTRVATYCCSLSQAAASAEECLWWVEAVTERVERVAQLSSTKRGWLQVSTRILG